MPTLRVTSSRSCQRRLATSKPPIRWRISQISRPLVDAISKRRCDRAKIRRWMAQASTFSPGIRIECSCARASPVPVRSMHVWLDHRYLRRLSPREMLTTIVSAARERGSIMPEVVKFPDIPLYQGWGAPHRAESDIRTSRWYRANSRRLCRNAVSLRTGPSVSAAHHPETSSSTARAWCTCSASRTAMSTTAAAGCATSASAAGGRPPLAFGRYRNRYTNDPSVAGKSKARPIPTSCGTAGLLALKEDSTADRGRPGYPGDAWANSISTGRSKR